MKSHSLGGGSKGKATAPGGGVAERVSLLMPGGAYITIPPSHTSTWPVM